MAALPLNTFRTETAVITVTESTVYTAPVGISTVFLMAQVTNVSQLTTSVTLYHNRGNTKTEIVYEYPIPTGDTLSLLPGKLVLESGDSLSIKSSANNQLKFLCSMLETSL